jgi:hypothetical protein
LLRYARNDEGVVVMMKIIRTIALPLIEPSYPGSPSDKTATSRGNAVCV